ncbi:hypothetical protein WCP94_002225 [Bilophila wadsworthia]
MGKMRLRKGTWGAPKKVANKKSIDEMRVKGKKPGMPGKMFSCRN